MKILKSKLQGQVLQEIELVDGSEYLIGRSPSCDLCLTESIEISRQHVKISQDENGEWVAQLVGRFGELFFNGQSTEQIILENSLSFHISPYDIEFSTPSPAIDPASSVESPGALVPLASTPQPLESPYTPSSSVPSYGEGVSDEEVTADGISHLNAYLEILWANSPRESLLLEGDSWTIGRDESSDITISKKYLSRKQCQITKKNNTFYITDLGSSNGTRVNNIPLEPQESQALSSHDIISVKRLKIKFLIKNPALENHNLNSLVPLSEKGLGSHPNVVRIPPEKLFQSPQKRKKVIHITIAVLALLIVYGLLSGDKKKQKNPDQETELSSEHGNKGISHLPHDQQMMIKDTFHLARTYYTQHNYELCLSEIKKLHQALPFYENSQEIESLCKEGRVLVIKQNEKERRKQEAKELREKVDIMIRKCKARMNVRITLAQMEACLSKAREYDPSHPQIEKLIAQIRKRDEQRAENLRRQNQYQRRVQRGVDKYNVVKSAYRSGKKLSLVIKDYQEYLKSPYPDPNKLKDKAQRELASIRKELKKKVNKKLSQCTRAFNKKGYKAAIGFCDAALSEEPTNQAIYNLRRRILTTLREKMKLIYDDSILEEQFGNVESAKEKWKQILKEDVESDEYFQRSRRKLRKYGEGI